MTASIGLRSISTLPSVPSSCNKKTYFHILNAEVVKVICSIVTTTVKFNLQQGHHLLSIDVARCYTHIAQFGNLIISDSW